MPLYIYVNIIEYYIYIYTDRYRGYGKVKELEKNDVIGSNENNYQVVKFKLMFIMRKL